MFGKRADRKSCATTSSRIFYEVVFLLAIIVIATIASTDGYAISQE